MYFHFLLLFLYLASSSSLSLASDDSDSLIYLWPLPKHFTHGNDTISVDPDLSLQVKGPGGSSYIVGEAFDRCKLAIFKHRSKFVKPKSKIEATYDLTSLTIVVESANETVRLNLLFFFQLLVWRYFLSGVSVFVF